MGDSISPETMERALRGEWPAVGHALSAGELGERLAAHRRGRYPGTAFGRAAISLYRLHPEQQSADFVEAWRSWVAAESTRQEKLRVRMNGMTADEMLGETGYVQQVGEDPVKALIAVGVCGCGVQFVKRSWNQRRCGQCRAKH